MSKFNIKIILAFSLILSNKAFSQTHEKLFLDKWIRIKTNILFLPDFKQYQFSLETKPKKSSSRVNCFELNGINNTFYTHYRNSVDLRYRKILYSTSFFKNNFLFVSPYSCIHFRNVKQQEESTSNIFDIVPSNRNFTSTSVQLGLSLGEQTSLKKFSLGFSSGMGLGRVLRYKDKPPYGSPDKFYIDIEFLIQLGLLI